MKSSGGQVAKAIVPPGFSTRRHLGHGNLGPRREDVTKLAQHDVERGVFKW
jgi:hypothetical protein